jgi:predicted nucleotidyltransferase component of viral defense system
MTGDQKKNMAASVRERLANLGREQKEDFQELLSRYARERLLYRLSQSSYRDQFVLKGAILFTHWVGYPHRPTRDLDFLSHGTPNIQRLVRKDEGLF